MMRVTFGTVATLAASFLVITALWPEKPHLGVPERALAQAPAGGSEAVAPNRAGRAPAVHAKPENDLRTSIETKLNQRLEPNSIQFEDNPLTDAVAVLSSQLKIDILFDKQAAENAGVALDAPVTLKISHANLTARVALELLLEQHHLSFSVREGFVMVTTVEHSNQIVVYNIRDLLLSGGEFARPRPCIPGGGDQMLGNAGGMMGGMGGGGGGFFQVDNLVAQLGGMAPAAGAASGQPGGGAPGATLPGAGGMGGGGTGFGGGNAIHETDSLAQLISLTIDSESWEPQGGPGTVIQYRDRLVVKNSQAVHAKVRELLEMLREAAADDDADETRGMMGGARAQAFVPQTN